MKKISDFCTGIALTENDELPISTINQSITAAMDIGKQAGNEVNKVFSQLQTIFPAWGVAFPNQKMLNAAKLQWSKALIEAGICTKDQISIGFRVARSSEIPFFPSPGMFVEWCKPKPEHFGLPSSEQAFNEIIKRIAPSHPAVMKAYKQTSFERKTVDREKYKEIYVRAYEILAGKVMRGESIDTDVVKGIENNKKPKLKFTPVGWVVDED